MLKKWRLMSLFTILALVLAGCGEPFISTLQPAGEVADQQYFLMILSTLIMVVVVVVVSFIFVFVIVRYRRSKLGDDHIPKQVEGNRNLEIYGLLFQFFSFLSWLFLLSHRPLILLIQNRWIRKTGIRRRRWSSMSGRTFTGGNSNILTTAW